MSTCSMILLTELHGIPFNLIEICSIVQLNDIIKNNAIPKMKMPGGFLLSRECPAPKREIEKKHLSSVW